MPGSRCRLLTFLVLLWTSSLPVAPFLEASEPPGPESADGILASARELYSTEGPEAALPEYERALAVYRESGDRLGEAITLGYLGNCFKRLGDHDKALALLQTALETKRELGARLEEGKTLSHLGLVHWERAEYDVAILHFEMAIAIGKELGHVRLEGSALNNLSLVYDELGDYERSLAQYEKVLDLYRQTDFPRGEGDTLGNLGGVHFLLGDYEKAADFFRRAFEVSERLDSKIAMSQDLGNLALALTRLGETDEALATFDRAAELAREAGLVKELADWEKGRGEALLQVGRYDEGLELYHRAVGRYEAAGLQRELGEALSELGKLHLLLGDSTSASRDLNRSLALARSIDHPRGVIANLLALGDLEWRRERYEPAVAFYSHALDEAQETGHRAHEAWAQIQLALVYRDQDRLEEASASAAFGLAVSRDTGAPLLEAAALHALADTDRRRGRFRRALDRFEAAEALVNGIGEPELGWRVAYGRGLVLEDLDRVEEALAAYRRAAEIVESVRGRLREQRFRAGYVEDKVDIYLALVRLLVELGRPDDAFHYSERLRARSYLDQFNRGVVPAATESQRHRERRLRQRIRRLERALVEETGGSEGPERREARALFSRRLAEAEREYQNALDDLRKIDPREAAAWSLSVPSASQVRQALGPDAAILEYVVGADSVFVFVLTREAVRVRRVRLSSDALSAKVELVRSLVQRASGSDWREPAASLADLLLVPVERSGWLRGKRRLYLAPHRILHYLPFAALPRPGAEGDRLLVEDYSLAYLPSASSFVHRSGSRDRGTLLALAPARSRLSHAPVEAGRVAEMFPDRNLLLVGEKATEGAFKHFASRYRVLHVATHGRLNKRNPLLSALELEPGTREDGRLEVHEILGLDLDADLVTLSACETALGGGYFGEVPAGDDFVGLTRAFLAAGSASVLASLWEVDDYSTLTLMEGFYSELGEGDKATALAEAQRRAWRAGGPSSHPFYWAPFVLVGEAGGEPPVKDPRVVSVKGDQDTSNRRANHTAGRPR